VDWVQFERRRRRILECGWGWQVDQVWFSGWWCSSSSSVCWYTHLSVRRFTAMTASTVRRCPRMNGGLLTAATPRVPNASSTGTWAALAHFKFHPFHWRSHSMILGSLVLQYTWIFLSDCRIPDCLRVFDFIFYLFFVSGPYARLSWPSRQLLSAR